MLATVVTHSLNAAQVFALLAVFAFAIYTIWCVVVKDLPAIVLGIALILVAASLLFGWGPA
jgi:hypothetical protein